MLQTTEFLALQRQTAQVTAKIATTSTIGLAEKKLKESISQRAETHDSGEETQPINRQHVLGSVDTIAPSVATVASGTEKTKTEKIIETSINMTMMNISETGKSIAAETQKAAVTAEDADGELAKRQTVQESNEDDFHLVMHKGMKRKTRSKASIDSDSEK